MTNVTPLPFKGDLIDYLKLKDREVEWLWRDGHAYIPVRPICDILGVNWKSQHRKLTSAESPATVHIMRTVAEDGKQREMICIAYWEFMLWLGNIHPSRVKDAVREAFRKTRDEMAFVLATHYEERLFGEVSGRDMAMWKLKAEWVKQRRIRGVIETVVRDGLDWFALKAMKGSMPQWMLVQEIRDAMFFGVIEQPPKGSPMHLQQPRPKIEPTEDVRQGEMFSNG